MRLLLALLFFFPFSALAAGPFVVTDPVDKQATHCGVFMDTAAKVVIAVTVQGTDKICKYDLMGLPAGAHVVRMTAIINDPLWGEQESAQSLPLAFTKPAAPASPSGVRLAP